MFISDPKKREQIRVGMIEDLESFYGKEINREMTHAEVEDAWITELRNKDGKFRKIILKTDEILREMEKEKAPKKKERPTLEF